MRIGELAENTGVNIETIRYYERAGILPQPRRAPNNYRVYSHAHQRRLRLVRRMRDLDFRLDEVRAVLSMIDAGDYTCSEVRRIGESRLETVRSRIEDLRRIERALVDMTARCSGARTRDCSMLKSLCEGGE